MPAIKYNHPAAQKLEEIAVYCRGLAYEIEEGNIDIAACSYSLILKMLTDEIVKWNREIKPKWLKGMNETTQRKE